MEKRVWFRAGVLPWLLLAPQLAVVAVFFLWPAWQALIQSLQQQDAFGTTVSWVGLDNFVMLWNEPTYLESFRTTLVFSLLVTSLGLGLGLLLAFFADRVTRGITFYRTLLLLPYAVAPVLSGVLWAFMFSSSIGVVAWGLRRIGLEWNHLLNANHAMALVVMAAVRKQISYNFLFFVAGLQAIPTSLLEAAAIDGASPWRRFRTIQFPLLSPTTFFLFVINMVYAFFDTFAVIDATTQGGPGKATSTLVYQVYFDGFRGMDFGSSAAQSVILMIMVMVLTVIQFRFIEKKVQY